MTDVGVMSTWFSIFKDVVDGITTLFPQFDYLFLFHHSCRHGKQSKYGLNVMMMSNCMGASNQKLRDITIIGENAFWDHTLKCYKLVSHKRFPSHMGILDLIGLLLSGGKGNSLML
jgi:hypothetical protein